MSSEKKDENAGISTKDGKESFIKKLLKDEKNAKVEEGRKKHPMERINTAEDDEDLPEASPKAGKEDETLKKEDENADTSEDEVFVRPGDANDGHGGAGGGRIRRTSTPRRRRSQNLSHHGFFWRVTHRQLLAERMARSLSPATPRFTPQPGTVPSR